MVQILSIATVDLQLSIDGCYSVFEEKKGVSGRKKIILDKDGEKYCEGNRSLSTFFITTFYKEDYYV